MSSDDANEHNLMSSELSNSKDLGESDGIKELIPIEVQRDQDIQLSGPSTSNNNPTTSNCAQLDEMSFNPVIMLDNPTNEKCNGSDSDSDVIFIEKKTEVIELSDDDSQDYADLLCNLDVPESVINSLKLASNKISLKLGEQIKNGGPINNIMVEVPTVIWELPWKIVTGLFKNPSLVKPVQQPKRKKKHLNHPTKPKRKLTEESSVDEAKKLSRVEDTSPRVKKEAELVQDSQRIVTHFPDPNKPPEFFEVSRFGRLIKKPTRLMDNVRVSRQRRKRRNIENNVSTPTCEDTDLETQLDQCVSEFSRSSENSIDSECCDRWILNSDAEGEEVDVVSVPDSLANVKASDYPSVEQVKNLLKKERRLYGIKKESEHNIMERNRRNELRKLFNSLLAAVSGANPELKDLRVAKINVLEQALFTIKRLEKEIKAAQKLRSFLLKEKLGLITRKMLVK